MNENTFDTLKKDHVELIRALKKISDARGYHKKSDALSTLRAIARQALANVKTKETEGE